MGDDATTGEVTRELNGVDVEALFQQIGELKKMPNLAKFKFRCQNRWIDCGHNRTVIKNIYGVGQEQPARPEPFVLDADEPPLLLGTDIGPNPVEYLLHAITACVTSTIIYHAAAKGVKIQELRSRTEGDIDIRGFLGLDDKVPRGFQDIRIRFDIKADAPKEKLEEILALGPTYSPVYDTVTRAVKVDVGLET